MGVKGGLKAKPLAKLPNLFVMGCVCHSFALCSEAACAQLPSDHFSRSSVRRKVFEAIQTLLELETHRLLKLSLTRWLSLEVQQKMNIFFYQFI